MTKTKTKKTPKKKPIKKPIKKVVKKAPVKKKEVKKTKSKYNWALMKQEFMTSEYLEVTAFFKNEYSIDLVKNGHVNKKVTGWTEEKKKFIQEVYTQTMESIKEKRVVRNTDVLEKLMELLNKKVEHKDAKLLSVKDLERLWGIFMTVNNKPTRYIKSDITDIVVPVSELSDKEKASLRDKLKVNGLI